MRLPPTIKHLPAVLFLCSCATDAPRAPEAARDPFTSFPPGAEEPCRNYLADLQRNSEVLASGPIYDSTDTSMPERFTPPIPVYRPPPGMPPGFSTGAVVMGAVVEVDGTIAHANVVRTSGKVGVDETALTALRSWGYDPARLDGEYVRSYICSQMTFSVQR